MEVPTFASPICSGQHYDRHTHSCKPAGVFAAATSARSGRWRRQGLLRLQPLVTLDAMAARIWTDRGVSGPGRQPAAAKVWLFVFVTCLQLRNPVTNVRSYPAAECCRLLDTMTFPAQIRIEGIGPGQGLATSHSQQKEVCTDRLTIQLTRSARQPFSRHQLV